MEGGGGGGFITVSASLDGGRAETLVSTEIQIHFECVVMKPYDYCSRSNQNEPESMSGKEPKVQL